MLWLHITEGLRIVGTDLTEPADSGSVNYKNWNLEVSSATLFTVC
jgi:hypothetical protein